MLDDVIRVTKGFLFFVNFFIEGPVNRTRSPQGCCIYLPKIIAQLRETTVCAVTPFCHGSERGVSHWPFSQAGVLGRALVYHARQSPGELKGLLLGEYTHFKVEKSSTF